MDTAASLRSLLAQKYVILPGKSRSILFRVKCPFERVFSWDFFPFKGGRDKQGNVLLQFPADSQLEKLSIEDLQRVILFLTSIPV